MIDHISVSQMKLFKACRRAYELRYVHNLVPVQTAETLQTGISYHAKLEKMYNDGILDTSDFSKESAMALAYKKYIYQRLPLREVESWVKGDGDVPLIGRVDGIAEDGRLVEHKTTSLDPAEYEYNLQWDEQILAYMLLTGARSMYYTICRKPTIRQKKSETDEEFFDRMLAWYDEDPDDRITVFLAERTDEDVADYAKDMESLKAEMLNPDVKYYRNTCHCNTWGRRCEYSSICLHYDPNQEYVEFTRKEG